MLFTMVCRRWYMDWYCIAPLRESGAPDLAGAMWQDVPFPSGCTCIWLQCICAAGAGRPSLSCCTCGGGWLAHMRWPGMELGARVFFLPVGTRLFDLRFWSAAPNWERPHHHWSFWLGLAAVVSASRQIRMGYRPSQCLFACVWHCSFLTKNKCHT